MANSNLYVQTFNNNTGLIPQSVPASYPMLLSTNAYQSLSAVLLQYQYQNALYNYASSTVASVFQDLQIAWQQTSSVFEIFGCDLETTYTVTFDENVSMDVILQWLDVDDGSYTQFTSTIANLAALVTYINTNVTTCTASLSGMVLSIAPTSDAKPNQLVRLSITNLHFADYVFAGAGVPADGPSTLNAIISYVPNQTSFYCVVLESNLYYPLVSDSNSTKITHQVAIAAAVEATLNSGDNNKVCLINTQDPANANNVLTTGLFYQLKALNYQRTMAAYYPVTSTTSGTGLVTGAASLNFAQTNGNGSWAEKTINGIVSPYLTTSQLTSIYNITSQGNLDPECLNGNYYTSVAGTSWFYPGITPSGLPFDITILGDNIAKACRYAQIQLLNSQANAGNTVPYNQTGINQMVSVIRGVGDTFSAYLTPVDAEGNLLIINAPTFAQIQANPALASQFANRVLTGITIGFIPSGSINKIVETFYATI